MATSASNPSTEKQFADQLKVLTDQLPKIIAVLTASAGAIYAVGFIVINSSLLKVGVLDLSLLRTGYLAAGLAYLFLFGIIWGLILGGLYPRLAPNIEKVVNRIPIICKNEGKLIHRLTVRTLVLVTTTVIAVAGALLVSWLSFYFKGFVWPMFFKGLNWPMFYWVFSHSLASSIGVYLIRSIYSESTNSTKPPGPERPYLLGQYTGHVLSGAILVGYFGVMLVVYGQAVYHTFPQALGGGAPLEVQFTGDPEFISELKELRVPVETDTMTGKLDLLMETNDKYIVQIGKGGVSFEKARVSGVLFHPVDFFLDRDIRAEKALVRGVAAFESGQLNGWESFFDDAFRLNKCFPDAYIKRGSIYIELETLEKANSDFVKATECPAVEKEAKSQAYYGIALVKAGTGNAESNSVIENLDKANSSDPPATRKTFLQEPLFNPVKKDDDIIKLFFDDVWSDAGMDYENVGKSFASSGIIDWAREEFSRALEVDPNPMNHSSYRHSLGLLELQDGDIVEATLELTLAANVDPRNPEYDFHAGNALVIKADRSEPEQAMPLYEVALEHYNSADGSFDPKSALLVERGKLNSKLSQADNEYFASAKQDLEDAVKKSRKSTRHIPRYHLARFQARYKQDGVLEILTNLLGDDPTYLQFIEEDTVFKWIVDLKEFSALRDEAESDMEELSSPDADEKNILGQTLAADGRLDEAIRAFRSAILIQPTQPEFDFNLANAFVADGRLPQAKEEYLEALRQKSRYGEAYCRLASIYQTYPSDMEAAKESWNDCIQLTNDDDVKKWAQIELKELQSGPTG